MMKKYVALFLALTLVLSLFTGCNADPQETTKSTTEATTKATEGTTAATDPVVEEIPYPEKVTVWTNLGSNQQAFGFTSNDEAYFNKVWEERTGTDIEWSDVSGEKTKSLPC